MSISEWEAHSTEDGETFYYNRITGKSSWETPKGDRAEQGHLRTGDWAALWSEGHGMHYYYNEVTGATQWENPDAVKIIPGASAARENLPLNSAAAAPQERTVSKTIAHHAHGYTSSAAVNFDSNHHHGSSCTYSSSSTQFHNVSPGDAAMSSSAQEEPGPRRHSFPSRARAPNARSATAYTSRTSLDAAEGRARTATAAAGGRRPASKSTSEREGTTLRQALSRKEDSLRRLKEAREAAQKRIARLKADTVTLRAAKSATAGKAAASVNAPPGDLDDSGSTPPPSRGMGLTIVTPSAMAPAGGGSSAGVRLVDVRVGATPISAVTTAERAAPAPIDAVDSRGGPATISSGSLLVEAGGDRSPATPVDSDLLAARGAEGDSVAGHGVGGAGYAFGAAGDSSREDGPEGTALLTSQLAKGTTISEETDWEMGTRRVNLKSNEDGGKACSGFLFGVPGVGGAMDFGALEARNENGAEYEEVRKGWEEASLLGVEASEELSVMLSATRESDGDGVTPPPEGENSNGNRRHELDQRETRGDSCDDQGGGQRQNIMHVPLANRALDRVAGLFELLASVGEKGAWLGRVSAENHCGCRRLVDFAATGARLLLLLPRKGGQATPLGGLDSPDREEVPASALRRQGRSICYSSLGCLALCGRISPDLWADLSREDNGASNSTETEALDDLKGEGTAKPAETAAEEGDLRLEATAVTRLLSTCVDLVQGAGCEEGGQGRTGLDEEEYFFGKRNEADGDREGGDAEDLGGMSLKLIFEVLTGCRKARVNRLRRWEGTSRLVDSLMDTVVKGRENSYMVATRALLAANDPFWRPPPPLSSSLGVAVDPESAPVAPPSVIIPALSTHPARHDVQSAVLHILNEEGYPNGDSELVRLCLVFCSDAFEAESAKPLFYVNDVKIMVDVVIRELFNLPTDDPLREDYGRLLRRILEKSEWGTRGERYREAAIRACMGDGREPSERDT